MSTHGCRVQFLDDTDPFSSTSFPEPSRPLPFAFSEDLPLIEQLAAVHRSLHAPHKLDDCALQLSHTGTYLDLESSLAEQRDDLDGFFDEPGRSKKHTIILRTQLSVRVNACIEKLYNSSGRELRRALFSLKQIFQDDKDLVHEFVNSEGLTCLVRVGEAADQNYQNYILRALGQIMLYVDGMNGVIGHNETIQWLYSLIASKFRLVARTALKLLLVFVEYTEANVPLLIHAAACADQKAGKKCWSTLISVLGEMDGMDTELLVFTLTLLNKTLAALPDQDSFFDVTDMLEELGMEEVARRHLAMRGVDQDLAEQFAIYEASLRHEDGEEDVTAPPSCRRDRRRSSTGGADTNGTERRRSRRHGSFVARGQTPLFSQSTSPRIEMLSDSELPSPIENDPALSPESDSSVNSSTSPFSLTTCSDHLPYLPYVPYTTIHLFPNEPAGTGTPCTTPSPTEEQSPCSRPVSTPCSRLLDPAYDPHASRSGTTCHANQACSPSSPTPAIKMCSRVGPVVTGSAAPGIVGSPGNAGLLSSSYKQHQESLAAERERRRQQREERLQHIEREERNKYNRPAYLKKKERERREREERSRYLERMAVEEREKELKPCTRTRLNLQPLVESLSPSTFSQVTSPSILSPSPSPTSRSPSTSSQVISPSILSPSPSPTSRSPSTFSQVISPSILSPSPSPTSRSPSTFSQVISPSILSPSPSPTSRSPSTSSQVTSPSILSPSPSSTSRSPSTFSQVISPSILSPSPSPTSRSPSTFSQVISPSILSPSPSPTSRSPSTSSQVTSPSILSPSPSSTSRSPSTFSQVISPSILSPSPSPTSRSPSTFSQVTSPTILSPSPSSTSRSPSTSSQVISPSILSPSLSPTSRSPSTSSQVISPSILSPSLSPTSRSPSTSSQVTSPTILSPSPSSTFRSPSTSSEVTSPSILSPSPSSTSRSPSTSSQVTSPTILSPSPSSTSRSPSTSSEVTSPTILSPSPSSTSRSPSPIPLSSPRTTPESPPQKSLALKTDSTSAIDTPPSPSEVCVPACTHPTSPLFTSSTLTISHSEIPPETIASTATTPTSQVSSLMMRKQDSGCREAEPLVLSEKERASVAVNEKEVCSASGSSSASSTLERDKAPSETAGGGSHVSDSTDDGRSVSNASEQCDSSALSAPSDPALVDIDMEGVKTKPEIEREPPSSIEGLAQRLNIVPGKPTRENEGETDALHKNTQVDAVPRKESDQLWDQLLAEPRELRIKDMDFTDLTDEDDIDFLKLNLTTTADMTMPPPLPASFLLPPPGCPPPPPFPGMVFPSSVTPFTSSNASGVPSPPCKKKTVRLFWNEVRQTEWKHRNHRYGTRSIWALLELVNVDTNKLELLFETKSKELPANKRTSTEGKKNELTVLDSKRSNAINIGLTVLPPARTIKTAILNFDEYALNKEGIEKLLAMIPTEEEKQRIREAQLAQPDIPLGPAEQFLLTMASISELGARLQLWAFKMDYESMEKEIVEPLADLKQGMEQLEENKTLRRILATLLAIGNFLNTSNAKGFELTYLEKVSEVKDTVRKQSLLHHLCTIVLEKFPDSSDLYSELGAVTRSAKVDFEQLHENLGQLERRCRSSWDHLKVISRHESRAVLRQRVAVFLQDCAARIIVLQTVHRRLLNRFHAFLLYAGHSPASARDFSVMRLCRVVSEFALEYRTTRERILQQQQKRASHRERNKTRGKMITDSGRFSSEGTASSSAPSLPIAGLRRRPTSEQDQEHESMTAVLQASLGRGTTLGAITSSPILGGSRGRSRRGRVATVTAPDDSTIAADDATDEIMDRIVRSATQAPCARAATRERRRSRANRKSLRRTLKSGLTPEEAKALGLMNTTEVQV